MNSPTFDRKPKRSGYKARALVITRKGYAVLRAVENGTYKFATTGRPSNCHGKRPL